MNNPSVNRYLQDKAMDHIDHALGRPVDPMRETYRNKFATSGPEADAMSATTYWEEFAQHGSMRFFGVTDAGRKALAEHLTAIGDKTRNYAVTFEGQTSYIAAESAAKARYSTWLEISDVFPDLTFKAFCRGVSARRAA